MIKYFATLVFGFMKRFSIFTLLLAFLYTPNVFAERMVSICHGEPAQGSLENGWQLPSSGTNYEAYSSIGVMAGRNYVHSKVYEVVVLAYAALEKQAPEKRFVYGESGKKDGGKFSPHKTHQNGLSVDFFVPVINANGESVALPTSVLNKFGYNIEFNEQAQYESLTIDFEAMANHLRAIKQAADQLGVGIRVVIFDNEFQKQLMATPTGKTLPSILTFSTKKPWVRHDEHYHIDFVIPCA
jgi:penicillin-insensitive murein DD-endopeptidase